MIMANPQVQLNLTLTVIGSKKLSDKQKGEFLQKMEFDVGAMLAEALDSGALQGTPRLSSNGNISCIVSTKVDVAVQPASRKAKVKADNTPDPKALGL
jgi:hypothetical protein